MFTPLLAGKFFHGLETMAKFAIGTPEGLLRVYLEPCCPMRDHKEEITNLFALLLWCCSLVQLLEFFCKFGMYTLHVRVFKADSSDAFLIFLANSKRGRCEGDTVQQTFLLDPFSCFSTFLLFDGFPV